MSSILFNESATVALTTLRSINTNLAKTQSEISTGKMVNTARDNAAIWAVSTVMQTDVDSFGAISNSLSLGQSTVGVASAGADKVTDLLQQMKTLITSAQNSNVDRTKIQTDIGNLKNQIDTVVSAAQFNGLNLLSGGGKVDILASLDRASDGTVTASQISVNKIDLSTTKQVVGTGTANITGTLAGDTTGTLAAAATATVTYTAAALTEGESFTVTLGGTAISYVARDGDTLNDVVRHLGDKVNAAGITGVTATYTNVADPKTTNSVLSITNGTTAGVTIASAVASAGTAGGDLENVANIDVTTDAGAAAALTSINSLLQIGIDASASFGSTGKRIDIQQEFVTTLIDAMKSGISALTDADMEEASARLQSLQVQQQLGIQALSIANQQPQSLLSLFR